MTYHLEAREDEDEPWSTECLDDLVFDDVKAAWLAADAIRDGDDSRFLGSGWVTAEWRVVDEEGVSVPRPAPTIIRRARTLAGLTQSEAAELVGTSQSQWAQWEMGHRTPSLAKLAQLVEALGCELRCEVVRR